MNFKNYPAVILVLAVKVVSDKIPCFPFTHFQRLSEVMLNFCYQKYKHHLMAVRKEGGLTENLLDTALELTLPKTNVWDCCSCAMHVKANTRLRVFMAKQLNKIGRFFVFQVAHLVRTPYPQLQRPELLDSLIFVFKI